MTSEKELNLSVDELCRISWKCSSCGGEQGLDISSDEQARRLQSALRHFNCAICGATYDSALFEAFLSLLTFRDNIKKSRSKVFFHVSTMDKEKENKP